MDQRYKPGVLGQLDFRSPQIDLPVSGGIRYDANPDSSVVEVDLNKTFKNKSGSITPSIGYTDERSSSSDDFANIDNIAKSVRIGVDGQASLGPVDLQGSAMGSRTRSNQNVSIPELNEMFSNSNVGTFTKIGIGARMGAFSFDADRRKRSGFDPVYSRRIGMNVGNRGRLEYRDSNTGNPTIGFNYRMDF